MYNDQTVSHELYVLLSDSTSSLRSTTVNSESQGGKALICSTIMSDSARHETSHL